MGSLLLVQHDLRIPHRRCPLGIYSETARATRLLTLKVGSDGLIYGLAAQGHAVKLVKGSAFLVISIINYLLKFSVFLIDKFNFDLQLLDLYIEFLSFIWIFFSNFI